MSNLTAALIKVDNLTIENAQAGAIKAGNFNFTNLSLSGNLHVSGSATATTKSQTSDDNSIATTAFVKSALGGVDVSAQLTSKANLVSPDFTGTPTAPTADLEDNTTQIATTEFVNNKITEQIDLLKGDAPELLNTLGEISNALNDDSNLAATLTTLISSKASLVSPVLTGVPLAPTAALGNNTTQMATTAFVNNTIDNFNNTINQLSGKIFCVNLIHVMALNENSSPSAFSIVIKFNTDKSFTLISRSTPPCRDIYSYQFAFNGAFDIPGQVYNYTFVNDQAIKFNTKNTGNTYGTFTASQRESTMTFNSGFTEVINFNETLTNFTIIDKANTIVNGIVGATDVDDFYAKFLVSYNANNGSADFPTPSATSVKSRYNIAEWQKNLAIYLMTRNATIRSSLIGLSSYTLIATLFYEQKYLIGCFSAGSTICGKMVELKMNNSFIESDAIYSENLPMEIHNSTKRLNGTSDGKFEPGFEIHDGKNCAKYEIDANGVKHIIVRGLDIIAHNNRIHLDPSQMNYIKGRSLSYCRHSQVLLSDTYWYPDGPEFRINLGPLLTVTKLIFNDVEVPLYLVKRKSWNPAGFETTDSYNAITFNIAKAGVTMKYSTNSTYTEDSLNKVEIWYQGTYVNNSLDNKAITSIVPSSNNISLGTLMGNPDMYEQCKKIGTKYGFSTQSEMMDGYLYLIPENPYGFPVGYYINLPGGVDLTMISPTFSDTAIEYTTVDQYEYSNYLMFPSNDFTGDLFYCQFEIMCPRKFVANSGGKRLSPVYSDDKQNILYRFVPGAKSVGSDYRSCYSTALAFSIRTFASQSETITLTDNSVINYYAEIPNEMKEFYNLESTRFNKDNIQSIIRTIESILGPYPFDTYGTAFAKIGSAMENFERAVYDVSALNLVTIIHETFHMWWQNKATFESNKDWWIDEGFNDFCDWFIMDRILNNGENYFYKNAVRLTLYDVENGFYNNALTNFEGTLNYDGTSFIFATMYYNFGSEFKTNVSGNLIVKPVNSQGKIAVTISIGAPVDIGLMDPVTRKMVWYGTEFTIGNNFSIVGLPGGSVSYLEGMVVGGVLKGLDNQDIVIYHFDENYNLINSETLADYIRLPDGPVVSYYQPNTSNTNFWNCMKYVLNTFSGKAYNFTTFKSAFGDYVEANKANWGNKWPSTKKESSELFDQMANTGSYLKLGGGYYKITIDASLLPPEAVTVPVVIPSKYIKLENDSVYYDFIATQHVTDITSDDSLNTDIDVSKQVVVLKDSNGVLLNGSVMSHYDGFDCVGKIVIVPRGGTIALKHQYAIAAGAYALIMIAYDETPWYAGFSTYIPTIPVMTVINSVGNELATKIDADPTVNMQIKGRFSINYTPPI
jgi:hypothetical protein